MNNRIEKMRPRIDTVKLMKYFALMTLMSTIPLKSKSVTYNIFSGTTWEVYDTLNNFVGYAQYVCLNSMYPVNCPPGATQFGFFDKGWKASIPGAKWMWAPGVDGLSTPASNVVFKFRYEFIICGKPTSGSITLAADNEAEVRLNGTVIGSAATDSITSTFTVPPSLLLRNVPNSLEITVRNEDMQIEEDIANYRYNPAGVLFGATFTDDLAMLPGCGDIQHGGHQRRSCRTPDGRTGEQSRQCFCGYWIPWGPCISNPPPSCMLNIASATPSACAPATNTYDLEVLVTYTNAPAGGIVINGRSFQPNGSGSERFTLTGLMANGATGASVSAAFTTNASCSASATYNAPANCTPPVPQCTRSNGSPAGIGEKEVVPCAAGCGDEQMRTCQLVGGQGQWSDWQGCKPMANAGEKCWDTRTGEDEKCCPQGYHCERKGVENPLCRPPWWCFLTLWQARECRCTDRLSSTEFFCAPD